MFLGNYIDYPNDKKLWDSITFSFEEVVERVILYTDFPSLGYNRKSVLNTSDLLVTEWLTFYTGKCLTMRYIPEVKKIPMTLAIKFRNPWMDQDKELKPKGGKFDVYIHADGLELFLVHQTWPIMDPTVTKGKMQWRHRYCTSLFSYYVLRSSISRIGS